MLTMKAKHATMLLTVTEVEGLSEGLDELDAEALPKNPPAHPSVVMVRVPDQPQLLSQSVCCRQTSLLTVTPRQPALYF